MQRQAVAAALAGCALVATGCGGATRTVTDTITDTTTQVLTRTITKRAASTPAASKPTTPAASASASNPTSTPQSGGGGLTVQDFSGDTLTVKSDGLIDPATPSNPDAVPSAGSRFVALEVTLTDEGPGTITSDANSDMTVIGTDGQAYTFQFGPVTECTNFSEGSYTLLKGDSERGCVVFELPDGVSVKSMQFSLGNGTVQFNNG